MRSRLLFSLLFFVFTVGGAALAQPVITYSDPTSNIQIGDRVQLLQDSTHSLEFSDILKAQFYDNKQKVANLEMTPSTIWAKFTIRNNTSRNKLVLEFPYPTSDSVSFYGGLANGQYSVIHTG